MGNEIIKAVTGFYPIAKAIKIAEGVQQFDDDWTYKVVDCKNGLGRIDVYDEDGGLVVKGFTV